MIFPLLVSLAVAACTPVRAPLIYASDLALVDSRFRVVPASTTVGFAPNPGSRRMFSETEVSALAKRFGLEGGSHEVCFAYAMHKLDQATVLAAIEQVIPGAEVELLEGSNFDVPDGRLVFSRASLPKPPRTRPDEPVIWRGYVEYAEGRKFTVWIQLRLAVSVQRAIVVKGLAAGQEISMGDVESRKIKAFPDSEAWVEDATGLVGRRVVVALQAGSAIRANQVQAAGNAVARGDSVTVEVQAGAAHLRMESRAESGAAVGGMVSLRNPKSGKVFFARVTGKGTAEMGGPGEDLVEQKR